jgi:transposase-like protein
MPFRESSPVEERIALLREWETGAFSVSELCRRHGISRDTFYVWKRRRESGEDRWFEERSHAAGSCPHATSDGLAARIVATRQNFPHFGPKKIKAWLEMKAPGEAAGGLHDRRHPEARRARRGQAPVSASDCSRQDRGAGDSGQRRMGDRLQGLVPDRLG